MLEGRANFLFKCRDRVLLDCSANLKVDEVEEDPDDEVSNPTEWCLASFSPGRH